MLNIHHIGIPTDSLGILSRLADLERGLMRLSELGFRLVELYTPPLGLIVHGRLFRQRLNDLTALLAGFDFRYSVHTLERLNLAYDPRSQLCEDIVRCEIEICQAIGAAYLVVHSGLQALDLARFDVRYPLPSDQELAEGARREVTALRRLAERAADAGVIICLENGDPHLWEYNVLSCFDLPATELLKYHGRLHPEPIIRQLEAIDHPNVALALDFAHLFLAANNLGFEFLAAVSQAAPWTKHLHLSDNFGCLDNGFESPYDRWAYGEADLHMPLGWGCIPIAEALKQLPAYEGDLVLEIHHAFEDHFGEALTTAQALLQV